MDEVNLFENSDSAFATLCMVTLPLFGGRRDNVLGNMLEVSNEIKWAIQIRGGEEEEGGEGEVHETG